MKRERLAKVDLALVEDKTSIRTSADKQKRKMELLGYRNKKYDPSMCEKVVAMMSDGKSRYVVANQLGVVTATLDAWEKKHEEFAEALHLGDEASRAYWEELARENIIMNDSDGRKFNVQLWTFNMKNRFYWMDKCEREDKSNVNETIERKEEIEKKYDEEHTAEVLDILKGIGAIKSAVNDSAKAQDDEVHKTGTDA